MRDKAVAVLGEAPGQGVVYRQRDRVSGESSFIRERARDPGHEHEGAGRDLRG